MAPRRLSRLDTWRRPITLFIAIAIGAVIVGALANIVVALAFACVVLMLILVAHLRDLTAL